MGQHINDAGPILRDHVIWEFVAVYFTYIYVIDKSAELREMSSAAHCIFRHQNHGNLGGIIITGNGRFFLSLFNGSR